MDSGKTASPPDLNPGSATVDHSYNLSKQVDLHSCMFLVFNSRNVNGELSTIGQSRFCVYAWMLPAGCGIAC